MGDSFIVYDSEDDSSDSDFYTNKKYKPKKIPKIQETKEYSYYSEDEAVEESYLDLPDIPTRILGIRYKDRIQEDFEYFVKFKDKAYIHSKYMTPKDVNSTIPGKNAIGSWNRREKKYGLIRSEYHKDLYVLSGFDILQDWFEIERVLDEKYDTSGQRIYFVKWTSLEYAECTWEPEWYVDDMVPELVSEYYERLNHSVPQRISPNWRRPPPEIFEKICVPIKSRVNDYELKDYQMDGVNWLLQCYFNKRNSILGDEMGLGKTAQLVCTLQALSDMTGVTGPFLITAPLSTLQHWLNEFKEWTELNAIIYHDQKSYQIIKDTEFQVVDEQGRIVQNRLGFDVLIMGYDTCINEIKMLRSIDWHYLIVDEGHRLKNSKSHLFTALKTLNVKQITLLTGTPIQNNYGELFSLLNFLDPIRFPSVQELIDKYPMEGTTVEQVDEIRKMMKPIMLRRQKADADTNIKPKEEMVIEVELTREQKIYYRAVFNENRATLLKKLTKSSKHNLVNICMELRKICNHPYLINGAEDSILQKYADENGLDVNDPRVIEHGLIHSSGKLILLDKLLPKLQREGHKVLIFSQFTMVLDIIEDFIRLRGFRFERLDGTVASKMRQVSINRFNQDKDSFIFLITTKAGGVGINLTAADTVILFDTDWNPQNDIQAMARCHRIGQTEVVKVYRLVSRETYEQRMQQIASKKLGINHIILEGKSVESTLTNEEIEDILRHGISHVFDESNTDCDKFTEADIDQILERSAKLQEKDLITGGNSIFAKSTFTVDDDGDKDEVNPEDPSMFWSKFLPQVTPAVEEYVPLIRRCRKREIERNFGAENKESDGDDTADDPLFNATKIKEDKKRMKMEQKKITVEQKKFQKAALKLKQDLLKILDLVIYRLVDHGFTGQSKQADILGDAILLYTFEKPYERADIIKQIGYVPINPRLTEDMYNHLLTRSDQVVESVIFFNNLRHCLIMAQDKNLKWPKVTPAWESPSKDYAVLLALYKAGWDQLPNEVNKKVYLMSSTPLLSEAQMRQRIFNLVSALMEQFDPAKPEPDSNSFITPAELRKKQDEMNPVTIVIKVCEELSRIGVPLNKDGHEDWNEFALRAKVNLDQDNLARLGRSIYYRLMLDPRSIQIIPHDKFFHSVVCMNVIHIGKFIIDKYPQSRIDNSCIPDLPDWWTSDCSKTFIRMMSKHGHSGLPIWLFDKELPFYNNIPQELLSEFDSVDNSKRSTVPVPIYKCLPSLFRTVISRLEGGKKLAEHICIMENGKEKFPVPVISPRLPLLIKPIVNPDGTVREFADPMREQPKDSILDTLRKSTSENGNTITPELTNRMNHSPVFTEGNAEYLNSLFNIVGIQPLEKKKPITFNRIKELKSKAAAGNQSDLSMIIKPIEIKQPAVVLPVMQRIAAEEPRAVERTREADGPKVEIKIEEKPKAHLESKSKDLGDEVTIKKSIAKEITITKEMEEKYELPKSRSEPEAPAELKRPPSPPKARTMTYHDVKQYVKSGKRWHEIPPKSAQISRTITIKNFGRITNDRRYFGKLTPFPIGFTSVIMNPFGETDDEDVEYKSEIREGKEGPIFVVLREDKVLAKGDSPSTAWKGAMKARKLKVPHISGSTNFGLTNPFVEIVMKRMMKQFSK